MDVTEPTYEESFRRKLRDLRQKCGWTQEELAKKADVDRQTVHNAENGPTLISLRVLSLLLDKLSATKEERAAILTDVEAARFARRAASRKDSTESGGRTTRRNHQQSETIIRTPAPELHGFSPMPVIGRDDLLETIIAALLAIKRFVVLHGPAGVGKSAIAAEAARRLLASEPVAADQADPTLRARIDIVPADLAQFDAVEQAKHTIDALLYRRVTGRRTILILDNIDLVLDIAPALGEMLDANPRLQILATTREILKADAVYPIEITPLDPHWAGALLIARAERLAVQDQREPDPEIQSYAKYICDRVDHLPLAIELVAARLRFLSAAELAHRMSKSLPLLTYGSRNVARRHRTMEAAISWNLEMLPPEALQLFRAITIFQSGWTLDAAERICGSDASDDGAEMATVVALEALCDAHLVVVGHNGAQRRFAMMRTIGEYARARAGNLRATLADRHAHYYARFVADIARVRGTGERAGIELLRPDEANIYAALDRAVQIGDAERALALVTNLTEYWVALGLLEEARVRLNTVLRLPGGSRLSRARAQAAAARVAVTRGENVMAIALAEDAFGAAHEADDTILIVELEIYDGIAARQMGAYSRAIDRFDAASARLDGLAPGHFESLIAINRALIFAQQGFPGEGLKILGDALERELLSSSLRDRAALLRTIGEIHLSQDCVAMAQPYLLKALECTQEAGDRIEETKVGIAFGRSAIAVGDYARARVLLYDALDYPESQGDLISMMEICIAIGALEHRSGDDIEARRYSDSAVGFALLSGDEMNLVRAAEGRIEQFTALVGLDGHSWFRAARHLGATSRLRERLGAPAPAHIREELIAAEVLVRAALGDAPYDEAFAAGQSAPKASLGEDMFSDDENSRRSVGLRISFRVSDEPQ